MGEMKKRGAAPNKSLFRRIAESEFFHNYMRSPSAIIGTVYWYCSLPFSGRCLLRRTPMM